MYQLGLTLSHQAELQGVDIRLNTKATPELIESLQPDALILAGGSTPLIPRIEGIEGDNVIIVNDYYLNKDKVEDSVVVLGGGLAGCECAVHLGMEGKKVSIVEMKDQLAADCNIRHRPILMQKVEEYTKAYTNHTAVKASRDGVVCRDAEGNEVLTPGKTIICAAGQRSNRSDVDAFRDSAPWVREIGDCARVSNITNAVYQGYHAALDI